jgi:hypothetical protein
MNRFYILKYTEKKFITHKTRTNMTFTSNARFENKLVPADYNLNNLGDETSHTYALTTVYRHSI